MNRGAYLRISSVLDQDTLEETPFPSIIHAFWYIIVTITTVGYGDMWPKTETGMFVGTVAILAGIIVLAMPVGVIGANFGRELELVLDDKQRRKKVKQQQETLAALEKEEDAAVENQQGDDDAIGLYPGAEARQKLLIEAKAIDNSWQESLPEANHTCLYRDLRQFVGECL